MIPDDERKYFRIKKITLLVAIVVLAAGLFGWWIGRSGNDSSTVQTGNTQNNGTAPAAETSSEASEIKSLISYKVPDGWREFSCPDAASSVFFSPKSTTDMNCGSKSAVKISVDSANNTDCNQLQNVQNVSKHICISEYINGKKSLKAETVFNEQSSYQMSTTVRAYYIDIGQTVIKVEYIDSSGNEHQTGFEQLAKSVKAA